MLTLSNNQKLVICTLLYLSSALTAEYIYKEGPEHGGNSGIEHKFVCQYSGFITGINYRVTVKVDQIEFICTSPLGNTTLGPYGGVNGKPGSLRCPPHHYISSFYGSNTTKLNRLGIRCRHQDDTYGEGEIVGDFGEMVGTNFDDLALSFGARPVSVTIKTMNNSDIDSIQVTYSNTSANSRTQDCNSEWSEMHGTNYHSENSNEFQCPDDGVIYGIEYSKDETAIYAITFKCKSSQGYTNVPFGNERSGRVENRVSESSNCDVSSYIQYVTGDAGDYLYSIDANCQLSRKNVPHTERKKQLKQNDSENFDDKCLSTNGRRPYIIKVFWKKYIHGIKIKYKNIPVELNCYESRIEIAGSNTNPTFAGFEVLGTTIGTTCSPLDQQISLSILNRQSHSITNATTTVSGSGTSGTFPIDIIFGFLDIVTGLGIDDTIGLEPYVGLTHEWPSIDSNTFSNATGKTEKAAITYRGPGAAVLVGYMKKYTITSNATDVIYHYTCEGGSKPYTTGKTIPMSGAVYGHVHFQDYYFPFGDTKCTSKLRICISRIKLNETVINTRLLYTYLKTEVNRCLNNK